MVWPFQYPDQKPQNSYIDEQEHYFPHAEVLDHFVDFDGNE